MYEKETTDVYVENVTVKVKYFEKYKVCENLLRYSNGVFLLCYLPTLRTSDRVLKLATATIKLNKNICIMCLCDF